MSDIYTIPDTASINVQRKLLQGYMRPNALPMAVVFQSVLSANSCEKIVDYCEQFTSYQAGACHATTRELPMPVHPVVQTVKSCGLAANKEYWDFDLDEPVVAWMQTYYQGDSYHRHTDASVGMSRKLTAVALLSDENYYAGGTLQLFNHLHKPFDIEHTRGTVVVFPSWTPHEVTEVTKGIRQTINMGWWGPPFK